MTRLLLVALLATTIVPSPGRKLDRVADTKPIPVWQQPLPAEPIFFDSPVRRPATIRR